MKNILLLVHDDAGQEARLQAALDVTRAVEGHLVCLDVMQMPVMGGDYFSEMGQVILLQDEQEREGANREELQDRLRREDVPWEMLQVTGDIPDSVAEQAGLADLIVTNRKFDEAIGPDMRWIAGTIALKSRKPVLAVSEGCRRFDAAGRAIVAWDGSLPVMAALTGTIPLLHLAQVVTLLEVGDGIAVPAEEAAAYLSRHGVSAIVRREARSQKDAAELIQAECRSEGAAYCIMGAYGHSPIREALLGGVTRRMLSESEVPLILAH